MKIERIEVQGFGAVHGPPISLTPRINVFLGENESGKSTLQQAILALLFGFYQGNRVEQLEKGEHLRFRPWQGGPYGGSLDYCLDSGQRFRIQRTFDKDEVSTTVIDLITGKDITRDLGLGRHGNVPVGRVHFGMSKEVFVSTCFVGQTAISSIAAPRAVAEAVVNVADTSRADTSADEARTLLEKCLTDQVGGIRARVKPLPIAQGRLQKTREELYALEKDQALVHDSLARKDELEKKCQESRERLYSISYLVISKRLEEVEKTVNTIDRLEREVADLDKKAEALKEYSNFPSELRDTIIAQKGSLGTLFNQRDKQQQKWKEASPDLDNIQKDIDQCHEEIMSVESARSFPLEKEETFNSLRFSREDSIGKLSSLQERMNGRQDRPNDKTEPKHLPKLALAGGLALAIIVGASLSYFGFVLLGFSLAAVIAIAVVAAYFLVKRTPALKTETDELEQASKIEQARISEIEQKLAELLQEVGIKTGNMDSDIKLFQRRAADNKVLVQKENKLQTLEERRKTLFSLKQQAEDSENQLTEKKTSLLQILRRAMIEVSDIEEGLTLFEDRYDIRQQFDDIQRAIKNLEKQRNTLLGEQTRPMLITRSEQLNGQKMAILAAAPKLSGATTEKRLSDMESEEKQLGTQLNQMEQEIAGLKATVDTTLSGHRQRAQIEEDLAQYEIEVHKLEMFSASLKLAREVLLEAAEEVHRDFAPRLAKSLGQSLSLVTHGRYDSAYVDSSDLTVSLEAPETGKITPVGALSTGTQEQAYLLLRIELARMLSATHESLPLIMDDPFVNFDEKRLHNVLSLLVDISKENQVLLFIKDVFISSWLCSNSGEGIIKVHEMPATSA